jgi:hypothetical protein
VALDSKIAAAIRDAVKDVGQTTEVADKLIAWVGDLTTGNAKIIDKDSVRRHLQILFNTVHVAESVGRSPSNEPDQGTQ